MGGQIFFLICKLFFASGWAIVFSFLKGDKFCFDGGVFSGFDFSTKSFCEGTFDLIFFLEGGKEILSGILFRVISIFCGAFVERENLNRIFDFSRRGISSLLF